MAEENMDGKANSINTNKSRRDVLRSVGGGISLGAVISEGKILESTTGEKVEIDYLIRGDETLYKEVPVEWKANLDRAEAAADEFRRKHKNNDAIECVSLVRGENDIAGLSDFNLKVYVPEIANKPALPNSYNNIPIKISEERGGGDGSSCYNTGQYSDIRAGIEVEGGTLGGVVEYDGEKMAVTNHHVVTGDKCDSLNTIGNEVYQSGQKLGEVHAASVGKDLALIDITNGNLTPKNEVLEQNGGITKFGAHYSENGVSVLISSDAEVTKAGTASGTTTGQIEEKDFKHPGVCNDFEGEGVRGIIDNAVGDSGSMVYKHDDGYNTMGLIYLHARYDPPTTGSVCDADDMYKWSEGTEIYHIDNNWAIDWVWWNE